MQRLTEILLGLDRGFLARDGGFDVEFRPRWPLQEVLGAAAWNLALVGLAVALVVWVYRREGKTRAWRLGLGGVRLLVLVLVIALLNRPTLTLTNNRVEPSVLAVLIDDSASMGVADLDDGRRRIDAATSLQIDIADALAEDHQLRLFRVSDAARSVEDTTALEPAAERTDLAAATADALSQLRGQNLAGVVLLSDGRDAPGQGDAEAARRLRSAGVPVYAVPVGGPGEPRNVRIEQVVAEPTVFAGDALAVRVRARAVGFDGAAEVQFELRDATTNAPVLDADGRPVTTTATLDEDAGETELRLETSPADAGETLDLAVVAVANEDEIDLADNRRGLRADVLDAEISVLYVEGYPRWEYRYLKNRLIRDKSIESSILLASADPDFAQEGDRPIRRFPVSMEELLAYDVVLFGDVGPRQFSDGQLELLREFVADNGGGFGMVAGPRASPWAWRGTAVESLLPVDVVVDPSEAANYSDGFRPDVTDAGERSGLFRFFADAETNEQFLETGIQELFWYAGGVRPRAGVGDVLATHPTETGPDGRPAPLVVAGRYGAGRTLFNAIDESWRWRYYTGEPIFDTFWVQQLRYLARGRKLGQRRATLTVDRPSYELGGRVEAELRLLDPQLAQQLPDRLDATLVGDAGAALRTVPLIRRQGGEEGDRYTAAFDADRLGTSRLTVPPLVSDLDPLTADVVTELPRAELERPAVDRPALARLAAETGGRVVELADANTLPTLIPSTERILPVTVARTLWDAPVALALLAVLLTIEWVGRKAAGLI